MNIDSYCKNPRVYKTLPADTRQYYDRICSMKQDVSIGWNEQLKKLGISLLQAPEKIISNMLTPQGLEMLGIFMGIDLTSKAALNGILRGIARGVGPEVMEVAAEQAAEQGASFINNAIISSVLGEAVEEGTIAATAFAITEAVSSAVSAISSVVIIIQFLGMMVDYWDPLGYSGELDAETMDTINNEFDIAFANKFLEMMTVGRDRFGRPIHFGQLPVEYRMDAELFAEDQKDLQLKRYAYTAEYLSRLEYNSNGHAMKPRVRDGELLNARVFNAFANSMALTLANQNTEVARWARIHVLLVAIGVGILLWLMLRKWE
jgi:hypothetical protein